VQEGGDVKFKATEEPPDRLPVPRVRAHRAGETHAHVTRLEPSEGTTRLLATLVMRDDPGSNSLTIKQRHLDLAMTHACYANPL
jgi:hypothetical protein